MSEKSEEESHINHTETLSKAEEMKGPKQKTVTFKIEPKSVKKPVRRLQNKQSIPNVRDLNTDTDIKEEVKQEDDCKAMTIDSRIVKKPNYGMRKSMPVNIDIAFKGNFVSQIPKAVLLTPSSSENSLATNISTDGNLSYTIGPKSILKSQLPSYLTLQRQHTAIINFRSRKAVSQIDFKEARRTGNLPLPNSQALVPLFREQNQSNDNLDNELEPLYSSNGNVAAAGATFYRSNFSTGIEEMCYMRTASLRIFNVIMLNSWRKRREEVRQLKEEIDRGTRSSIKIKNQLHIFKSLFRSEQLRNNDLNNKVRLALQELSNSQDEQKDLQKNLEQAKVAEEVLKQELMDKYSECEGVNVLLENTKSKLFQAMSSERDLLSSLSKAQRDLQDLQFENSDLKQLVEISKTKFNDLLLELDEIIVERGKILVANQNASKKCEQVEQELKDKNQELLDFQAEQLRLQEEMDLVKSQIGTLQQCLAATLGNRLKNCFNQSVDYHRATYQLLHWVAFYILPAAPPPRVTSLPVGVAIKKVKAFFNTSFSSKSKEIQ